MYNSLTFSSVAYCNSQKEKQNIIHGYRSGKVYKNVKDSHVLTYVHALCLS